MLDIKYLRENTEKAEKRLFTRGKGVTLASFKELDGKRRAWLKEAETLRAKKNRVSEEIGKLKKEKKDASALIAEMAEVCERLKTLDKKLEEVESQLNTLLLATPNIPHETVPVGIDPSENRVERVVGEKPSFAYPAREHFDIGEALGIMDSERAAKIAGARFPLLKGAGALMERALINFMLDLHTHQGYTEVMPPFIAKTSSFTGTGQLPKFEEDIFKIAGWDGYLVPTAEVSVTNIHREETLKEESLPVYYTAYTPCFRKEAGSYGKDVKGLIRQHQFNKVELVKFTTPETSYAELERLTCDAEEVLKRLGLHYRVVSLCTGDLGFASAKTYDLEVWLPGQGRYREISSCSNFEDFQARRAEIKYRPKGGGKLRFVHTLNASGLAVGRTLVAILENFQQEDGTVLVPSALRPYMGGLERISRRG